ncbi:hypothetical protein LINPERHAP2_LOCUS6192 [Linum perenne]
MASRDQYFSIVPR